MLLALFKRVFAILHASVEVYILHIRLAKAGAPKRGFGVGNAFAMPSPTVSTREAL